MINFSWSKSVTTKSGEAITLRYPQEDDASKLLKYFNPIVEENTFILVQDQKTLEEESEYIQNCLKLMKENKAVYIYAVKDEEIIGVVDVRRERDKMSHVGLMGITVTKPFRGQGLGKILMAEVTEQAKSVLGLDVVRLTCFAENKPAIGLYEKMGFKEYGRLPKALQHQGEKMDQVEMYKEL